MKDKLQPPKPIADLVIREVPGNVLHFAAINTEIAERLYDEFKSGELGSFGLHDEHLSGYLHYPWPINHALLARYMAKIARCKYIIQLSLDWGDLRQENRKVSGGRSE